MSMSSAKKRIRAAHKAKDKDIMTLQAALFTENNADKDVTKGIAPAFMKYDRNGCDLAIEFSSKLKKDELKCAFETVKDNMEAIYDSSGYGWSDEDKERELTEDGARFLLVYSKETPRQLVAFCHFRFTVQGDIMDALVGDPCIYVWDIHVMEEYRRRGLGKHLLTLLTLIGTREKMQHLCIPVQMFDHTAEKWIESIKGFGPDTALRKLLKFDPDVEGFQVYTKSIGKPGAKNTQSTPVVESLPPVPSTQENANDCVDEDTLGDDGYDIISKEEVLNIDHDGQEQHLSEEEIVSGLQQIFFQKHGRNATEQEVEQWKSVISSASDSEIKGESETVCA